MNSYSIPSNWKVITVFLIIGILVNVSHIILDDIHIAEGFMEPLFHGIMLISYILPGFYVTLLMKKIREAERTRLDVFERGVSYASKDVRNRLILIFQSIAIYERGEQSPEDTFEIIRLQIKDAMELLDDLQFKDDIIRFDGSQAH
ncbi:MAG: hypothetical protein PVJ38_03730 [Candidatus Bathyarchaeota archaeon]|jgi:hypothetical protein